MSVDDETFRKVECVRVRKKMDDFMSKLFFGLSVLGAAIVAIRVILR